MTLSESDILQGLGRRAREAYRERREKGVLVVNGGRLIYNTMADGDDGSDGVQHLRELLASYDPAHEAVLHFLSGGVPTTRLIRIAEMH